MGTTKSKKTAWTLFWDMHSGGGQKEKWSHIYIEAPIEEAKVIFYNRFGHNPERVTCTCCGEDYSIDEDSSFSQLSAFHRGCRYVYCGKTKGKYIEKNAAVPKGYKKDGLSNYKNYKTVNQYKRSKDVLVIPASEIKNSERIGEIPKQGYIWI